MKNYFQKLATRMQALWYGLFRPRTGAELMKRLLRKIGPFEIEEAERKLGARSKGRRAGAGNLPSYQDADLDAPQVNIRNYFTSLAEKLRNLARELITARLQTWTLAVVDFQAYEPRHIEELGRKATHETTEIIQANKFTLHDLRKRELGSKRELNFFRAENDLHRSAKYPESSLFHWGILLGLIMLESFLNGNIFAKGSDAGIIGGTVVAVMISVLNVLLAAAVGAYPLRWTMHKKLGWRVAGVVLILCYFPLMVFINLVVGHYRALLDTDPDLAGLEAAKMAWQHGLNFGSFDSLILFGLGIGFSMAAMIKAFFADDKYPGYGKVQRHHEEQQRIYREKREEIGRRVLDSLHTALQQIDNQVEQFGLKLKRAALELAATTYVFEDYGRVLVLMNKNCMEIVQMYRDENQRVRTDPPPVYFMRSVNLETTELGLENEELLATQRRLTEFEQRFEEFKKSAERQKHHLDEIHQAQLREVNDFVQNLEKDADREFRQDLREQEQIRIQVANPNTILAQPLSARES